MDDTQTIDAFVDSLTPVVDAEVGSSPEPETPQVDVQQTPLPVAPDGGAAPEVSSSAVDPAPVATPPAIDPALQARLDAIEAEARAATERANQAESLIQQARDRAMQQQEQARLAQQRAEWEARAVQIETISDPEMQKREARRLVAEVEQARAYDAQRVISHREQLLAQREQESESTAAIGAALYQSIQNDPDLTAEQKQRLIDNSRHLSMYPNPQAQQAALEREQKVVQAAVARAKAEWEKAQGQATAAKVQQRITSDTDLVGTANGAAGGRGKTVDDFVDSIFR